MQVGILHNLLGWSVLVMLLRGNVVLGDVAEVAAASGSTPPPVKLLEPLPPLPDITTDFSPRALQALTRLSQRHTSITPNLVPSIYRHLGIWGDQRSCNVAS